MSEPAAHPPATSPEAGAGAPGRPGTSTGTSTGASASTGASTGAGTSTRHGHSPRRSILSTRVLLSSAAIGVATGAILAPFTIWGTLMSTTAPLAYMALTGVWLLGPLISLAVLRRPGAALMTCVVVGLIQMPFGGAGSILTMLMIGAAMELPFLVTRYRVWSWWLFSLSALAFLGYYAWAVFGFFSMETAAPLVQIAFVLLGLLSGQLAVWLSLMIAMRLRRAGLGSSTTPRERSPRPAGTSR